MKKALIIYVLFLTGTAYSQGTLRGKVSDENGETIIGARISLKEDPSTGTKTDLDGNYTLLIKSPERKTLLVTFVGMDTVTQIIQLKNDEVIVKDFSMVAYKVRDIKEVKVVVKQVRANDYYMEKMKLNSATTIDYISSETMKKTGDANVTAAVARVSGVSNSGGLITVRGIGDRYVKTTLNGSRIPTLDPLTNNIKLDIFPTSLVDNLVITKTASPDLPGDWTGAYISVETKDYPEKLMVNVESQFGYNVQSTFRDYITSARSNTDWLGFDGGLRSRTDAQSVISAPVLQPTNYQEMVALGLGDFYRNIGVTGWSDGSPQEETYLRLGLVQLGVLNPSQMNDQDAYQKALKYYNSQLAPKAFSIINPEGTDFNNGFANNWNTRFRKAPVNFTQNFSIGDQVKLFGRPLGYIFGFRYGSTIRYDPNGISQRIGAEEVNYPVEFIDDAQMSRETNSWSMLANLAYKINDFNKVSFLVMPNYIGTNDVASFSTQWDTADFQEYRVRKNIFYEQRKQMIYQWASQHLFPKSNIKIESNISYTRGSSVAPDFKLTQYDATRIGTTIVGYQFSPNAGDGIRRYYRYLRENLFDSRLSVEVPLIKPEKKLTRKLKFGTVYQSMIRNTKQDEYFLVQGNSTAFKGLQNDDIDAYLNTDKFIISNGQIDFYYQDQIWDWNRTVGNSSIAAGYGLIDFELLRNFRFNGGLRIEKADLFSDIFIYDFLGYGKNDGRRVNIPGYPIINPGIIDEVNFLPSGSVILKIGNQERATTNLRFNFSQTVARPNIREMSASAVYDNEFRTLIYGNPNLKVTQVNNFDFRLESFFRSNDNISFSLFYKDFTNHIEMGFGSSGITWDNNENSFVAGIELEGKKQFGKFLEFRSNLTIVKSYSEYVRKDFILLPGNQIEYFPVDTVERTMFGQAPYIVNGMLTYKSDSLGLTATVSYNIQGPRLVITGILKGRPDIYEMPRHSLDFKVSKSLGKHFSSSVTIRDILNAPVLRSYKLKDNTYVDFDRFRYGALITMGVSYKL